MSANKNFEESFMLCNNLEDGDRFSECSYGIVHEQFIQSGTENFFELCQNYTDRRKTTCYELGSLLYPKWKNSQNVNDLLELCDELNGKIPNELNYCYASIAGLLEFRGETPNLGWCENLEDNFKELCLTGLSSPQNFWIIPGCSVDEEFECGLS